MTKRILTVAMLLMMIAAGALAAVSVPEPDSDLFYVYDGAKVLSTETEAQIYYNNVNLYKACGAEIVFVVVDDTDGYALEDYSAAIFDKWELYDRDVLVVLAIDDEDYWMVQGSSIEREMTGSTMRALLEDYLEPDFAKQNYDSGVRKLFDALFAEVTDIYNADISLVNGYEQYKTANEAGTQYADGTRDDYGYYEYSDEDEGLSFGTILLIIIIVLVVTLLIWFLQNRTVPGFEMRLAGTNSQSARYAGVNITKNMIMVILISGALSGLGGALELQGNQYKLMEGITKTYGFDAVGVAVLGQYNPFGMILSSLLFAMLRVGAGGMERNAGVPEPLFHILQGVIIVCIIVSNYFVSRYLDSTKEGRA